MKTNKKRISRHSQGEQQVVIHPVLFAINSILFLYVEAFSFVDAWAITRSIVLSTVGTALLWIALRWWLGDLRKSALLTSLTLTLFFAYGAIAWKLNDFGWFPGTHWDPGSHAALWVVLTVLWGGVATLVRKYRLHSNWTYFANVFGTAAVVIPLMIGAQHTYTAIAIEKVVGLRHESLPTAGKEAVEEPPDIYWILPDTYARADILADVFDYDNQPFIEELKERGFSVSPEAVSNYSTTALSVASILNMDYMQNLIDGNLEDSSNWWLSRRLLNENRLGRFLQARGYTTYSVATQYDNISWRSDNRISRWWFLNYFEANLLPRTPIQVVSRILGMSALHEHHRARTRFALDWVGEAADLPGPKFVFVQVVTPHPPFIFGPRGEAVNPPWRYSWAEGMAFEWMQPGATKSDYIEGFRGQVQYINRQLIETVDRIQARSKRPPVIVVMSDHGPASGEWLSDLSHPSIIERFGILNALRLPDVAAAEIPEDFSAVNTFRFILNQYFDARLDMLEPKTYYTLEAQPYRYIPIELTQDTQMPEAQGDSCCD
jgi:hypothetical protein